MSDTRAIAERLAPDLRALRRELHQRPELGLDNPWTQTRILEALAGLDLEITLGADRDEGTTRQRGLLGVRGTVAAPAQRREHHGRRTDGHRCAKKMTLVG